VIVRSPSWCTIVFGREVCGSSVTRQSMPPSGLKTIVPSASTVTVPRWRSGKKTKNIAFEFEKRRDNTCCSSSAVISRAGAAPCFTVPLTPSKVSTTE
jgi:hypothetical protein